MCTRFFTQSSSKARVLASERPRATSGPPSSCSPNGWDLHGEAEAWGYFQRVENLVRAISLSFLPWQYKELIFPLLSFSFWGSGAHVAQARLKLDLSLSVTLTSWCSCPHSPPECLDYGVSADFTRYNRDGYTVHNGQALCKLSHILSSCFNV